MPSTLGSKKKKLEEHEDSFGWLKLESKGELPLVEGLKLILSELNFGQISESFH